MEQASVSKTVIITGNNSGLGFECAKSIANKGWQIVPGYRDAEKQLLLFSYY